MQPKVVKFQFIGINEIYVQPNTSADFSVELIQNYFQGEEETRSHERTENAAASVQGSTAADSSILVDLSVRVSEQRDYADIAASECLSVSAATARLPRRLLLSGSNWCDRISPVASESGVWTLSIVPVCDQRALGAAQDSLDF